MVRRKLPKKERELILLKDFISNESLGLRVKSIVESETPDFIVKELKKDISIEVTELIHPKLREKEVFREKLIDRAHKIFKEKYDDELYVLISFSNVPIKSKGKEFEEHANDLFKKIEDIYLPNKDYKFDISTERDRYRTSFIDTISVSNNRNLENWQSFGAFKVNSVDKVWIDKIILDKESMIKNYSNTVNEHWLLMVSNFGFKSDTHTFHYLLQNEFESKFDKIFIYKYRDKEILELK
jgi:hypothetical protein